MSITAINVRNQFRGTIKEVIEGPVVSEVDVLTPNLERWADRIQRTLEHAGEDHEWIAVAHSLGCLALARHLVDHPDSPIRSALLVAPAEPDRFGLAEALPHGRLGRSVSVMASQSDPG